MNLSEIEVNDLNIKLNLESNGFILYNLSKPIEPFYHASSLIDNDLKININNNSEIDLKIVNEIWNFSNLYQFGERYEDYFWLKPAISFKLGNLFRINNSVIIDSLKIKFGNLWREKDADGLLLQDFESQGAVFQIKAFKRFSFEGKIIGSGWTGSDDYNSFKLGYNNFIFLSYICNIMDNQTHHDNAKIINLGSTYAINNIKLKADISKNFTTKKNAGLLGIEYEFNHKDLKINTSVEYRHYDDHFFFLSGNFSYPYFNSLTSLDKKVNNFRLYQIYQGNQNIIAFYVNGHYEFYDKFFLQLYFESILGKNYLSSDNYNLEKYAYDFSIGYNVNSIFFARAGMSNKFFLLYSSNNPMFNLDKTPWFFGEIRYEL